MKKIKPSHRDILLTLFVNYFGIDWKPCAAAFLFLCISVRYYDNDFVNIICVLAIFIILFIKMFILLFFYDYMEKHTKSYLLKSFIKNLRLKFTYKIVILFITLLSPFYFIILLSSFTLDVNVPLFLFLIFAFTGAPSYLILYLGWWIEDLIKKRKMHNSN